MSFLRTDPCVFVNAAAASSREAATSATVAGRKTRNALYNAKQNAKDAVGTDGKSGFDFSCSAIRKSLMVKERVFLEE